MKLLDILSEIKVKGSGPTGRLARTYTVILVQVPEVEYPPGYTEYSYRYIQAANPEKALVEFMAANEFSTKKALKYISDSDYRVQDSRHIWEYNRSKWSLGVKLPAAFREYKKMYFIVIPGDLPDEQVGEEIKNLTGYMVVNEIKVRSTGPTGRRTITYTVISGIYSPGEISRLTVTPVVERTDAKPKIILARSLMQTLKVPGADNFVAPDFTEALKMLEHYSDRNFRSVSVPGFGSIIVCVMEDFFDIIVPRVLDQTQADVLVDQVFQ